MCGRYASFRESQDLADAFDVEEMTDAAREVAASWNLAPTGAARIVLDRAAALGGDSHQTSTRGGAATLTTAPTGARRQMHLARWGLVPAWAKDLRTGARMFNARRETLQSRPAFRKSVTTRRCVVLADGYYEWRSDQVAGSDKPVKTPFYIHPADGAPIAFAGLYAWWRDPDRADEDPTRWVLSTTIITTAARDGLEAIHDREPVMLTRSVLDSWLDPGLTDTGAAAALLAEPGPELRWHEVGQAVGSVRNDDPSLIEAV